MCGKRFSGFVCFVLNFTSDEGNKSIQKIDLVQCTLQCVLMWLFLTKKVHFNVSISLPTSC